MKPRAKEVVPARLAESAPDWELFNKGRSGQWHERFDEGELGLCEAAMARLPAGRRPCVSPDRRTRTRDGRSGVLRSERGRRAGGAK
jgi:hypothetical protein